MYNKIISILSLLIFTSVAGFGQTDWKIKNDRDGIRVYTSAVPNSKVKALKVECDFQATLSQLVSVLLDVKTCKQWVYHTKSCVLLKQPSPSEVYYYSEVSLPWPAENRDFVAHLSVTQDANTKVVTVEGPALHGLVPAKEGVVRITNSKGRWVITPLEKNEIRVEYTLTVDPAGDIPSWLVNLVSSEGPMQSFKNLKGQLTKPEYRNASLSFIKN